MAKIIGWYLEKIDFSEAPASLKELRESARCTPLDRLDLAGVAKWEPLLQGRKHDQPEGWVRLDELASFRRGIATGANGFFLLSREQLLGLGIELERALPCVGRAADVEGLIFTEANFIEAERRGAKLRLLNLSDPLSPRENEYVQEGEREGLLKRYLLANRRPWYSMEQRPVAPIWAAVFGRGDLKFVYNEAGVRSLTNFHCIYPKLSNELAIRALTLCLNAPIVRQASRTQGRVYGGGLNKFEPNDLKSIFVPDVSRASPALISAAVSLLAEMNRSPKDDALLLEADNLCREIAGSM